MSLFNTRELWSTHLNDEEGFSDQAMVIANVDNSPDDRKKIIIGSLSGLLRIFSVNSSESGYQANDLLLETELKYPILQLTTGQYLSASDNLNLAILHPRKLSVYSVSGTSGYSEHGSSYNILLIYEHNLQRSAYNMVSGPFGQVKGREFLCVQSIDGSLSFYEQESFAFSRFLPNFLIPGPIVYIPATDSFVVSTGCWSLESYRYQVLAISKDGENRDDATTGKGRRVTSDWSIILNEAVLDMQVIQVDKKSNCIVVLGERSLTVFKESGSNLFSKKLDYTPTCMTPYLNSECLMVAVCSEFNSILVYNSESLKWAAQLPFVPVAVHRDTVAAVQGCLVFLSDSGHLSCNYLGTVPELHLIHVNNSENAITNYAEAEAELQELKHIINAFNTDSSGLVAMLGSKNARVQQELDIIVSQFVDDSETDHGRSADIVHPVVNYDIRLVATANLTNVRAMLQVPWPLVTSKNVHVFSSVASDEPKQFQVKINLREPHLPANLKMNLVVAFTNKTGIPRLFQKEIQLPMVLIALNSSPPRETEHSISLDVVCHASIDLKDLFVDLIESSDRPLSGETGSCIGINFYDKETASVSIAMTAKPPKQKYRLRSDSFSGLSFMSCELINRLQSRGVKFDSAILNKDALPTEAYLQLIDDHLAIRKQLIGKQDKLAKLATEYRTIEKRFLVKLKDRNPTPLNDLDLLLDKIYSQIARLTEDLIAKSDELSRKTSILNCATDLILKILTIGANLKVDQISILRATLTNCSNHDEGWQERTELALSNLLTNHMKDMKDVAQQNKITLEIPKDSERLKQLLIKLIDKTYSGEILSVKNSSNSSKEATSSGPSVKNFVTPSNEIIPEEDEEEQSLSAIKG